MIEGFTTYGHRSEFCTKPDGSVTSQHEFTVTEVTHNEGSDFGHATLTCVCGAVLNGSRNTVEARARLDALKEV